MFFFYRLAAAIVFNMESVGNIGRASPGRRHADMDASFLNKVRRIRKKQAYEHHWKRIILVQSKLLVSAPLIQAFPWEDYTKSELS